MNSRLGCQLCYRSYQTDHTFAQHQRNGMCEQMLVDRKPKQVIAAATVTGASNSFYILQTPHGLLLNVFKIGQTCNALRRGKEYPKGSQLIECIDCPKARVFEKHMIQFLKQHFTHRRDMGNEYYEATSRDQFITVVRAEHARFHQLKPAGEA